jgi:hypothetical protein
VRASDQIRLCITLGVALASRALLIIGPLGAIAKPFFKELAKVKSAFAKHSAVDRSEFACTRLCKGTAWSLPREKGGIKRQPGHLSPFSAVPFASKFCEKRASFAYFGRKKGRISLQARLHGGGRGIRTLGTLLPP